MSRNLVWFGPWQYGNAVIGTQQIIRHMNETAVDHGIYCACRMAGSFKKPQVEPTEGDGRAGTQRNLRNERFNSAVRWMDCESDSVLLTSCEGNILEHPEAQDMVLMKVGDQNLFCFAAHTGKVVYDNRGMAWITGINQQSIAAVNHCI